MVKPKKSLGQHFLKDGHCLDVIVRALEPVPGEPVVEIGAGRGALTRHLLAAGLRVHALEIDQNLVGYLEASFGNDPNFSLTTGDAVTADYAAFGPRFKVAGNLPYQAATAITARLLEFAAHFPLLVLMYQKEVAQRITAAPGSRAYGWLSCLAQYHCETEYVLTVPPGAFTPPPKVQSGVVRYRPHAVPALAEREREDLFSLIRDVFSHRRKTLLNVLVATGRAPQGKTALQQELAEWGIDTGRRPETFSLDEFMLLRKVLGWETMHHSSKIRTAPEPGEKPRGV